jgi:hypothetical protein
VKPLVSEPPTHSRASRGPTRDAAHPLPPLPWFEPGTRWSARRVLLHVIAETDQHADHADIIRGLWTAPSKWDSASCRSQWTRPTYQRQMSMSGRIIRVSVASSRETGFQ